MINYTFASGRFQYAHIVCLSQEDTWRKGLVRVMNYGRIFLQTTATKITEGTVWHSVTLERMGRMGTVIVDNMKTDFSTPGVSANLIIGMYELICLYKLYFNLITLQVNAVNKYSFLYYSYCLSCRYEPACSLWTNCEFCSTGRLHPLWLLQNA